MTSTLRLNTITKTPGARKISRRVGRGMGSGFGKTCGRGVKGQHSRSGGYHKVGFEGGQMPIQRRLPKFGFSSLNSRYHAQVRLHELNRVNSDLVDLLALKKARLIGQHIKEVKVMLSGELTKKFTLKGIKCTKGARKAIESLGGKVED